MCTLCHTIDEAHKDLRVDAIFLAQIDEKTKSSPIYDDVVKILKEVSDGLTDGSKVELAAISGADVIVKLEGPASSGMMKDMTLGFLKQKLTDGTGRQINVATR